MSDVWSSRDAGVAAAAVFRLALENPVLRPSSSGIAERTAASLAPGGEPIPRRVLEEVIAALPKRDVARMIGLAEQLAPQGWRMLVEEVGHEAALEPLLAGVATAAVSELRPPPRWLVAMRETTADTAPGPLNVLASLLHSESVWSVTEIEADQ